MAKHIKSRLIIINWLLSLLLLTYNGGSLILTLFVSAYFSFASWLLLHNKENIITEVKEMDGKIDRLIAKFTINN
ncbi:hypothetical protein JGH11_16805 [Dysgonomonas sp. Marseille-P4677]|uniref:hypothetical protein n=1 Tax=Dysgonomonas sp. Marseille-P4677 TaxID=2364790 RepID=UPI001911E401|nr:hypothetical protein [Dysgonomonas sp. Marseille-P4677]MBK5722536.1 hypothetical protein [Dysgonomonas sp. Marseille-P4677]